MTAQQSKKLRNINLQIQHALEDLRRTASFIDGQSDIPPKNVIVGWMTNTVEEVSTLLNEADTFLEEAIQDGT